MPFYDSIWEYELTPYLHFSGSRAANRHGLPLLTCRVGSVGGNVLACGVRSVLLVVRTFFTYVLARSSGLDLVWHIWSTGC